MTNKIFKTIMILTICLGITLPSYAAISVSDGSAFMTKAEFMADVNNLSSRIAQLEIDFDKVLDTKINSYIEQKGFWQPTPQTFAVFGTTALNTMTNVKPFDVTDKTGSVKGVSILLKQDLITMMNDTGMCLMNLSYKANTTTDANMRWGYTGTKSDGDYYDSNLMLVVNFYETLTGSTTETLKASIVLGQNVGQMYSNDGVGTSYVNVIMLPKEEIVIPIMFFVNKDSKISWELVESYGFTGLSAAPDSKTNVSGVDIMIKDCVLY